MRNKPSWDGHAPTFGNVLKEWEETKNKTFMKKDIKDYLHLYLGCEVEVDMTSVVMGKRIGKLVGISIKSDILFYDVVYDGNRHNSHYKFPVKLILRPLSDMTEEEAQECYRYAGLKWIPNPKLALSDYTWPPDYNTYTAARAIMFLLSKGFDLFNLIHEGLAIDKTKIPQPNN